NRGDHRRTVGAGEHPRVHPEPLTDLGERRAVRPTCRRGARRVLRSHVGLTPRRSPGPTELSHRRRPAMSMLPRTDCEGFHRRDFLAVGSAGLLGLTLPSVLAAEAKAREKGDDVLPQKARSVILVWLAGGPATIDMWDNKPEAPEGIRGEFKSIDTNVPGIQFAET